MIAYIKTIITRFKIKFINLFRTSNQGSIHIEGKGYNQKLISRIGAGKIYNRYLPISNQLYRYVKAYWFQPYFKVNSNSKTNQRIFNMINEELRIKRMSEERKYFMGW